MGLLWLKCRTWHQYIHWIFWIPGNSELREEVGALWVWVCFSLLCFFPLNAEEWGEQCSLSFDEICGLEPKANQFYFSILSCFFFQCKCLFWPAGTDNNLCWLCYWMLLMKSLFICLITQRVRNCLIVCLFLCSFCLERGDRRGVFVVHWTDPLLQGWAAPQHDFGWRWRSYQPRSY